ncbi:MAG: hypothetical protein VXX43_04800, partial [Pseudomonadota bacterium]|nr:hypothetical protein [Pseudomonadota bacterium]
HNRDQGSRAPIEISPQRGCLNNWHRNDRRGNNRRRDGVSWHDELCRARGHGGAFTVAAKNGPYQTPFAIGEGGARFLANGQAQNFAVLINGLRDQMVGGAFAADKIGPTRNPQTNRKRDTAAKGDGEEYNSKRFAHNRDAGPFKTSSLVYFFSRIGKIIHIKSKSMP